MVGFREVVLLVVVFCSFVSALEVKSHSLGRHVGGALRCCPKARSVPDSRVRPAFTAPFGCIMDDWQPEGNKLK